MLQRILCTALIFLSLSCSTPVQAPPKVESAPPSATGQAPADNRTPRLVVVSWDGLRPEFYLNPKFPTPNLQRLRRKGAFARGMRPIYPSVTYPNHTTMLTGKNSSEHGIWANTWLTLSASKLEMPAPWYFEYRWVKTPSLWTLAHARGLTTAALGWPVTVGAPIDFNIPEQFTQSGTNGPDVWEIVRRNTPRELIDQINVDARVKSFSEEPDHDKWMTDAARSLLTHQKPDLLFIHLVNGDHVQHEVGRNSSQTLKAVADLDVEIGRLLENVDLTKTFFVVLGDHGFVDTRQELALNVLFVKQKWITLDEEGKIKDWLVYAHGPALYVRYAQDKPAFVAEVFKFLRKYGPKHFGIIPRKILDAQKAFPEAVASIEPKAGFNLSSRVDGEWIRTFSKNQIHGAHGFLPESPQLQTGLLIAGPGIKGGRELGHTRMTQIAPTLADLADLSFEDASLDLSLELGR